MQAPPIVHVPEPARAGEPHRAPALELADVGAAMAVCDATGRLTGTSPGGRDLLARLGVRFESPPARVPAELWRLLVGEAVGTAVQWRSSGAGELLLGCTRYPLGSSTWMLLMKEIAHDQNLLARRLHRQRLEALGRLVATTAHDLRSPLSSIVFNSDVLAARLDDLPPERVRETVNDLRTAAARLRSTIDCLLDYGRVGPSPAGECSIKEVFARMHSLVRPHLRAGGHRLVHVASSEPDRVLANPISVEQVLVNLVMNSIEAAHVPITVRVSTSRAGELVETLVEDDGPGIPDAYRLQVFDPFFTTKPDGTGIGLSAAREAARAAGGDVRLVRWTGGAAFAVLLRASPVAPGEEASP